MKYLDGLIELMDMSLGKLRELVRDRDVFDVKYIYMYSQHCFCDVTAIVEDMS